MEGWHQNLGRLASEGVEESCCDIDVLDYLPAEHCHVDQTTANARADLCNRHPKHEPYVLAMVQSHRTRCLFCAEAMEVTFVSWRGILILA